MDENQEFMQAALHATPTEDLGFLLDTTNRHCTVAAFKSMLYHDSIEVTDRAHHMGYPTDGHRYFEIPLEGAAEMVPLEKLAPTTQITLRSYEGYVRPSVAEGQAGAVEYANAVVRVSRGNGDEWFLTRIYDGPLVPVEPRALDTTLIGKTMAAVDAKELGFCWARVEGEI